jgi:hypothetical protein
MLRRTLSVLTPALFALPLLLTPTSQLYADDNVYSGIECKFLDDLDHYANETQQMGDVRYDPIYGMGNAADDMKGTNPTSQDYSMRVLCPLPPLDAEEDEVVVSVIDATLNDDVGCQIAACVSGIGQGTTGYGLGSCAYGQIVATRHSDNPADGYTNGASGPDYIPPVPAVPAVPATATTPMIPAIPGIPSPNPGAGPGAAHVTQNVDFLTFNRMNDNGMINTGIPALPNVNAGAVRVPFAALLGDQSTTAGPMPFKAHTSYHLECTIPEASTGALAGGSTTDGISYIQRYAVMEKP